MKAVGDTLGVARSNLVDQLRHPERRRLRVAQVAPHRVPRDADLSRDLTHAFAVLGQHPDLQRQLSPKHTGPRQHDEAP